MRDWVKSCYTYKKCSIVYLFIILEIVERVSAFTKIPREQTEKVVIAVCVLILIATFGATAFLYFEKSFL